MRQIIRLYVFLIAGLSVIVGSVVLVGRAAPNGCLVSSDIGTPSTAYDIDTGAVLYYKGANRYPPGLSEVSHDRHYVVSLTPRNIELIQYDLVVRDLVSGKVQIAIQNAAQSSTSSGMLFYAAIWSPNDDYFTYLELTPIPGARLKVFRRDGSLVGEIDDNGGSVAWSADSAILAVGEVPESLQASHQQALHFWWPEQGRTRTYTFGINGSQLPISYDCCLAWSPVERVLAAIATNPSPNAFANLTTNGINNPATLFLATPTQGIIAEAPLSPPWYGAIRWSPDGRYVYVPSNLFAFDGAHLTPIPLNVSGEGIWTADSSTLIALHPNADKTSDLVAYHVLDQQIETRVVGIEGRPQPLGATNRQLIIIHQGAIRWVEIMDANGQNRVKIADLKDGEMAMANRWNKPIMDGVLIDKFLTTGSSTSIHLIWARLDGSTITPIDIEFERETEYLWLKNDRVLYTQKQTGGTTINLLDLKTMKQSTLVSATTVWINRRISGGFMLAWRDANTMPWLDAYNESGKRLYHILSFQPDFSSPGATSLVFQAPVEITRDDLFYLELLKPLTGRRIRLPIHISNTPKVWWKPIDDSFAVASQGDSGQGSLDVFDSDGQLIRHFDDFGAGNYTKLTWMSCDQIIDPPRPSSGAQ